MQSDVGVSSQADLGSAALQALRGVVADDPLRAMQALPGVATGDDFQAQFSMRGSAFRQVGIVIDGIATPMLMHAVRGVDDTGSIAMINSDVLSHASLASGAYPQRHGGWLVGALDFDVREGSRDRVASRVAVSGTSASTVVEGPLGPGKGGSWLLSLRRSYIDWLIRKIEPSIDDTLGFSDLMGKAVYDLTPPAVPVPRRRRGRPPNKQLRSVVAEPNTARESCVEERPRGAFAWRWTR